MPLSGDIPFWESWHLKKRTSVSCPTARSQPEDSNSARVNSVFNFQHSFASLWSSYRCWEACHVVQEVSTGISIATDLEGTVFDWFERFGGQHGPSNQHETRWDSCGRNEPAKIRSATVPDSAWLLSRCTARKLRPEWPYQCTRCRIWGISCSDVCPTVGLQCTSQSSRSVKAL